MSASVVALAGNPNTGKTSLFNVLTGSRQKVGNWPGVTVERKEGRLRLPEGDVLLVDLPGVYSLGAASVDEQIASEFLQTAAPKAVVAVVDASNLERSLYLVVQLLEAGAPVLVALNMVDAATDQGVRVDPKKLEDLLGVPVVPTVARTGEGAEELKRRLSARLDDAAGARPLAIPYGRQIEASLGRLGEFLAPRLRGRSGIPGERGAVLAAEGDPRIGAMLDDEGRRLLEERIAEENRTLEAAVGMDLQTGVIERRWHFVSSLTGQAVSFDPATKTTLSLSDRVDRVVTNRFLGLPLFLAVAWVMFRTTFLVGDPTAEWLEGVLGTFGEAVTGWLEAQGAGSVLQSFVVDGLLGGVGSVVVFVPHIFILFAFIALLEDSGYMARGAFVMDRIMRALGLHGKSFIPMLIGFGCGVPAIMGTRILDSPRDRQITLLVLPFVSCSARLPVFLLFAGTFFGQSAGNVVFALYVLGIAVAVVSAKVLAWTLFSGETSQFVMELPPYRLPKALTVVRSAGERAWLFVRKAGTVIFGAVLLVWALASLPLGVEYGSAESLVGRLGHLLAPIFAPLGFGFWQAGVALFFGFLAKEVVVGTFGTLLGTGEEALAGALPALFTPLSALSFMVMTLLYVPCVAVVGAYYRETNSWKWTAFFVLYSTGVAYVLALAVFQAGRLLGLG